MRPSAKQLLAENGLEAMIITTSVHVRYLTGLHIGESDLLVTKKGFILLVPSLELEAAQKNAPKNVDVVLSSNAAHLLKKIPNCAFEEDEVSVSRLKRWKKMFPETLFKGSKGIVEHYRRTKDADELRSILKANVITEKILAKIPSQLKAGITEQKLSWIIECWARIQGAEKMGFETIVAFGEHTSRPHHKPTTKKLKKGDLVQIDMGVVVDGYTSDRSAVYFTGKPTEKQKKVLSALQEAKNAGIEAIANGVACSEPDRIARDILKKYGFEKEFMHSLGHGVGLEVHEGVSLSSRSKDTFMEHEVVTVEPGVYFEGKWGMRLEDMVIVQ
jgi:Xaa-Pro aminopeptidase